MEVCYYYCYYYLYYFCFVIVLVQNSEGSYSSKELIVMDMTNYDWENMVVNNTSVAEGNHIQAQYLWMKICDMCPKDSPEYLE